MTGSPFLFNARGIIPIVKKLARIFLFSVIIFVVFLFPLSVINAQTLPVLAILEIDIRPEFDKPGVLVVYHMVLNSDTRLPATLTVRIPTRVGDPSLVAWVDPTDGSLVATPFTIQPGTDYSTVTFTTSAYEIDFEYHDPALVIENKTMTYKNDWIGDYDIKNLSIYIQQPVGVTEMSISPALGSPNTGENNITYYYARLGNVDADASFSINIKYEKSDQGLSWEQLQVKPSGDLSEDTPGRTSLSELMPWLMGGIGVLILLGVIWWIWLAWHSPVASSRVKDLKKSLSNKLSTDSEPGYCHHCGNRAQPEDIYCRVCGSKLKD